MGGGTIFHLVSPMGLLYNLHNFSGMLPHKLDKNLEPFCVPLHTQTNPYVDTPSDDDLLPSSQGIVPRLTAKFLKFSSTS